MKGAMNNALRMFFPFVALFKYTGFPVLRFEKNRCIIFQRRAPRFRISASSLRRVDLRECLKELRARFDCR